MQSPCTSKLWFFVKSDMFSTFLWKKGPGILSPGKVWSDEGSGDLRPEAAAQIRAESFSRLWSKLSMVFASIAAS